MYVFDAFKELNFHHLSTPNIFPQANLSSSVMNEVKNNFGPSKQAKFIDQVTN